ncbi:MAG: AIR carboxylase family protein, partial [Candidatus Methanomethylophilaceae archaeon]|nr:AIR carboxylase family protein [Candidatus Methanomethylophilaceae archaeon]
PVASVGLDRGDNAAVLAIEMLAIGCPDLQKKLSDYRQEQADKVIADSKKVKEDVGC